MADHISTTDRDDNPISIAARDRGGVLHPINSLTDSQGQDIDPARLQEALEMLDHLSALRMAINSLTRTIGMTLPDIAGRQRVNVETGSIGVSSLPTLANVTTLATLTALVNQQQMGGFAANDQIPALMRMSAAVLRNNITVTA